MLIHNQNGDELISTLSKLLNPGGVLVVEKVDFTSSKWVDRIYGESRNKVNDAGCQLFKNMGLNPAYGMDVILDIQKSGLEVLRIVPQMHLERGNSAVAQVMGESIRTLRDKYIGTGRCNGTDIDNYIAGAKDKNAW